MISSCWPLARTTPARNTWQSEWRHPDTYDNAMRSRGRCARAGDGRHGCDGPHQLLEVDRALLGRTISPEDELDAVVEDRAEGEGGHDAQDAVVELVLDLDPLFFAVDIRRCLSKINFSNLANL